MNRRFQLSKDEVRELVVAYQSCKDGPTRTRYQAVKLYGTGYPTKEVEEITGCTRSSLMTWCRAYRAGGTEALVDKRAGGNRAKLDAVQLEDLRARLHTYTPGDLFGSMAATTDGQCWTIPDLKQAIEQWYGVIYRSRGSFCRIFHLCGFSYQRPAKVYKSRSATKVAEFEEQLEKNCSISPKMRLKP
jgi:transposase